MMNTQPLLIQGHLQMVFDALYHLGVIDPVLEMDWSKAIDDMPTYSESLTQVITVVNTHQSDTESLVKVLEGFDDRTLSYLAMEVAREYADFHSRQSLH